LGIIKGAVPGFGDGSSCEIEGLKLVAPVVVFCAVAMGVVIVVLGRVWCWF
jgi:hypothetical protein